MEFREGVAFPIDGGIIADYWNFGKARMILRKPSGSFFNTRALRPFYTLSQ
jgi:hypothetical protein